MTGIVFAVIVFLSLIILLLSAVESWRRIRQADDRITELQGMLELHQSRIRGRLTELERQVSKDLRQLMAEELRHMLRKR